MSEPDKIPPGFTTAGRLRDDAELLVNDVGLNILQSLRGVDMPAETRAALEDEIAAAMARATSRVDGILEKLLRNASGSPGRR